MILLKQLKCTTDEHPCANCRLYGSDCTYASLRKGPGTTHSTNTRKRKSRGGPPLASPPTDNNNATIDGTQAAIGQMDVLPEIATLQTASPPVLPAAGTWNLENPEMSEGLNAVAIEADFNQYAREFGLVSSFFGRPESLAATDPELAMALPLQLPSPDVSGSQERRFTTQQKTSVGLLQGMPPLPSKAYVPLPGLLLKRDPSDCKFLGLGAVGTTISTCLKFYMEFNGGAMEADLLDNLVQGMRHVDEIPLHETSSTVQFTFPNLPNMVSAGQCIGAYFENIHLRHPIVNVSFLDNWQAIYHDSTVSNDPMQLSRFCLIVALGQLSLPLSVSSSDLLEMDDFLQAVQSRIWILTSQLLAFPFANTVEVMLLHVMYLLYCGKGGIAWMTCGIAIRIAQSLGLHRYSSVELGLKEEEHRRRSRLWEVAVTLDAFLSLTEGRPPAVANYPTMVTVLSDKECPPKPAEAPGKLIHWWNVQLSSFAHRLAVLLDQTETTVSTLEDLSILDQELLQWRDLLPMEYRPEQENLTKDQLFTMISWLHLHYFHLMRTLHWVSYSIWSQRPDMNVAQYGARIRSSETISVNMSRTLIGIVNTSDETGGTDVCSFGFPVSYCMAAVSILFRHIVKRPSIVSTRTDLEILRTGVLHILRLLHGNAPMKHFADFFASLQRISDNVILKLSSNNS